MPKVFCDNNNCIHNEDLVCECDDDISLQAVGDEQDLVCDSFEEEKEKEEE